MLTYVLALVVVLASLGLYSTTFVIPEVSRKNDLIWSGVGLFYGLVLWVCAGRITGGVLLGQMASVALMGWMGWQMVEGRWNSVPEAQRVSSGKVAGWRSSLAELSRSDTAVKLKKQAQGVINKAQQKVQDLGVPVETGAQHAGNAASDDAAADLLKRADVPLTPEDFGNPPKAAVDTTATKPSIKSFSTPPSKNLFSELFDRAKALASGLNAPKQAAPKEVYVRKEFRDRTPETSVASVTSEIAIDDDFDFGDSDPDLVEPTVVLLSADEITAMKPMTSPTTDSSEVSEVLDETTIETG
ncbi:MAG: Ycf66 family protein, partial [Alkalinema sp. CAN_BIN05]|nr:Ycf66 family protein [Alkalinema sp. CAN_BIN05]